ncbi:MAG TPA: hypothetical protein VFY93_13670 [Planctomycetota bacterium]|nr:hypothetical protein [Planctomycetota bacterium]
MDFWAQHKDFILKILAGVGVFLVALIARSITYGDELESEQATNASLVSRIGSLRVAKQSEIQELQKDADRLLENAQTLTGQIGWDLSDDRLDQKLLRRILRYTRTYAQQGDDAVQRAAEDFRSAIHEDLNGGFGRLRLMVRQDLVEEAKEKNIRVDKDREGIGFDAVTDMADDELLQYLMQLELVARVARAAIDARVDSFDDVRITTSLGRDEVIPGANPAFLKEYAVTIGFTASPDALYSVLNQLEEDAPHVPFATLHLARVKRPENHIGVEMTLLATAANPSKDVPFKDKEKKP